MKIPPFLIVAAVIFWGVESSHLLLSLILAAVVAGALTMPLKWNLSDEDSVSVFDLTSVIFLAASAIIFINVDRFIFLKTLVIWMPPILLPPLLAQFASRREKLVIGTRFGLKKKTIYKRAMLDFKIQYLATCLLATAMANSRSDLFFPCMAGIVFCLLYANRGRAFSTLTFVLLFLLALAAAYVSFKGAEEVHDYISKKTRSLIRGYFYSRYSDPYQARLSFGTIGRLKQSAEIVLRVTTDERGPFLLRQAVYESFEGHSWYSSQKFEFLPPESRVWNLLPAEGVSGKKVTIDFYLPKEKGLLPHPAGSYQVQGEMLYELEIKADGIIKVVDGAPLVTYDVFYDPSLYSKEDIPISKHLILSERDERTLENIVGKWPLEKMSENELLARVKAFFRSGFTYSLVGYGRGQASSALENFLFETRDGYCELYATATVLLLRKVGIPSRYVTGFVAQERGWMEDKIIVRERHAHAWCEAFVDGRWVVVDTTPPDWFSLENEQRSSLEKVKDVLSFLRLKYDQLKIQTEFNFRGLFSLLALLLAAILAFRIYKRMGKRVSGADDGAGLQTKTFDLVDSPLHRVQERLLELGYARKDHESFSLWVRRIDKDQDLDLVVLEELLALHNRLRFDPAGLTENEIVSFGEQAEKWLEAHPSGEGAGEVEL